MQTSPGPRLRADTPSKPADKVYDAETNPEQSQRKPASHFQTSTRASQGPTSAATGCAHQADRDVRANTGPPEPFRRCTYVFVMCFYCCLFFLFICVLFHVCYVMASSFLFTLVFSPLHLRGRPRARWRNRAPPPPRLCTRSAARPESGGRRESLLL